MAQNQLLLQSVRHFLDKVSKRPKTTYCPVCGFFLEHEMVTLFLQSTGETWKVELPFCAMCDQAAIRHVQALS